MLIAYPPRGVIRLLPADAAWGDKPKIERWVAEEYILDTIHFFDGDRVECAKTLALGRSFLQTILHLAFEFHCNSQSF